MTHIVSMTSYSFGMNYPSLVARHNCITMMWHGNHRYLSDNTYTDDPRNSGDTVLSKPSQWSLNDVTFAFIPTDEIVKFAY